MKREELQCLPTETVIIAGPTGVGKTALSLRLAGLIHGEIVGADAFQIYAGLPLLTAQPTAAQRDSVPHHLIGSVDPAESYDAGRYRRQAEALLREIVSRGKRPIIVGGTGLYLKSLLGGLDDLPGNDPYLRERFSRLDLPDLIERLRALDPDAPAGIDLANRRRVERALEIVMLTGKPLAVSRTGIRPLPVGVRAILLVREREELHERIAANVEAMFARGVESEVESLPEERVGTTASMTLGLREIRSLLRGEISRPAVVESITTSTRRYAKRQMTWFRNQHDFPELNMSGFHDPEQAMKEACRLMGLH